MLLSAMAKPANSGLSVKPGITPAAIGIRIALYSAPFPLIRPRDSFSPIGSLRRSGLAPMLGHQGSGPTGVGLGPPPSPDSPRVGGQCQDQVGVFKLFGKFWVLFSKDLLSGFPRGLVYD
jgi:hypothetical protein